MPDFMQILAVDPTPSVDDPPQPGDDDLVWENIQAIVERVVRAAPNLDFTLVYAGARDWIDIHAWVVRGGTAESEPLQLSLERDVCHGSHAKPAPEVALSVDVDGDDLIDLIDRAVGEDAEYENAPEGREIVLPFRYEDEGLLLEAAAEVAKHLVATGVSLVVRVEGRFYELRLVRAEGAQLVPLWPWMTDPAARALVRGVLDSSHHRIRPDAHRGGRGDQGAGARRLRAAPRRVDRAREPGRTRGRTSARPRQAARHCRRNACGRRASRKPAERA